MAKYILLTKDKRTLTIQEVFDWGNGLYEYILDLTTGRFYLK